MPAFSIFGRSVRGVLRLVASQSRGWSLKGIDAPHVFSILFTNYRGLIWFDMSSGENGWKPWYGWVIFFFFDAIYKVGEKTRPVTHSFTLLSPSESIPPAIKLTLWGFRACWSCPTRQCFILMRQLDRTAAVVTFQHSSTFQYDLTAYCFCWHLAGVGVKTHIFPKDWSLARPNAEDMSAATACLSALVVYCFGHCPYLILLGPQRDSCAVACTSFI